MNERTPKAWYLLTNWQRTSPLHFFLLPSLLLLSLQASDQSINHRPYSSLYEYHDNFVDRGIVPCSDIRLAVGMTDRGAKALTDEDAKLFIGNLSYHVSNYNLTESKELNQDLTSSRLLRYRLVRSGSWKLLGNMVQSRSVA